MYLPQQMTDIFVLNGSATGFHSSCDRVKILVQLIFLIVINSLTHWRVR